MVTVRGRVGSSVWPSMCRSHVYITACLVLRASCISLIEFLLELIGGSGVGSSCLYGRSNSDKKVICPAARTPHAAQ